MSGEQLDSEAHPSDPSKRVFTFRQTIPIPSYLTALVVGDLESRSALPAYYNHMSLPLCHCVMI